MSEDLGISGATPPLSADVVTRWYRAPEVILKGNYTMSSISTCSFYPRAVLTITQSIYSQLVVY